MDDHKFFIDFFGEHANDEHCCAFCGATKDLTTIGSTVYCPDCLPEPRTPRAPKNAADTTEEEARRQ